MKILHIGLTVNGRGEGLSGAFLNSGHEYKELPVDKLLPVKLRNFDWSPDLVFCQIQNDIGLEIVDSIKALQKKGAFVLNWTGDVRDTIPAWMLRFPADLTTFSNNRDVKNFSGKSAFLQIGFDPKTYKKWENTKGHDVVFMGNEARIFPESAARRSMIQKIRANIKDFAVYGGYPGAAGSLNPDPKNPFPIQSQESKIYSGSKIGINYSHYTIPRYTSDRMFRMLGSGVMVLSHYYPEIEEDFVIGEDLDVFNGHNEMIKKINYYLEHEEERAEIAANGYDIAHRFFTYENMVKEIIWLYEQNRK